MPIKILVFTGSEVCLVNAEKEHWDKHNISLRKTSHFEEAVRELKSSRYLLVVVSCNRQNVKPVQKQIRILRSITAAPIAAVAEETLDVSEKIAVLVNGADQFIELPLTTEEAVLSILSLVHQNAEPGFLSDVYHGYGIIISPQHRAVLIGGSEIELVKKEFDILCLLMRNYGIVMTYEQIFASVWGQEYIDNSKNVLWNQIRRLRDKIQISPHLPNYIKTVHGIGYSFDPQYLVA